MINNREIREVNLKDLKLGENSRFRADGDLSELMESIKHNGILQPITARAEDKVIICGNRRYAAASKLGLDTVPVIFIRGVDDKQLLVLNLMENIQRKDITSIEIGRQCDIMLKSTKFKMSMSELASALGVKEGRVKTCLDAFKHLPADFRDQVKLILNGKDRKIGDLPESIVRNILSYGKQYKPLNSIELKYLLNKAAEDKLTILHLNIIGHLFSQGMPLTKAVKELDSFVICRCSFIALKTELADVQKKEKIFGKGELFKKIVKDQYPNLLY